MADLKKYFWLTGLMMKNCLVREMQFKANFVVRFFTEMLWLVMQFVFIGVIYGQANGIAGWSMWQMIVLAGTNHVITQLFEALFYDNCTRLTDQIRQGDLDFNLIKPVNSQFLVSLRYTDYSCVVNSTLGVGIIFYALNKLGATVGLGDVVLFAALIGNSVIIYYSILFSLSVWTFWIGRSNNLMELYWQFGQFSRYPGDIYPWLMRKLLETLIPMLVVSNFPAGVLIDKLANGLIFYGFALGLIFFAFTVWIWNKGLQRYRSASS